MPASTIVESGGKYRLYPDSVRTFRRLPVATYAIHFSRMGGYSLRQVTPLAPGEETVYGSHVRRVDRIVRTYQATDRSLGVLLSGDKGMGKSLMIRMIAQQAREQLELPTILVQHSTPGLASFLDELDEAVVVFDEFEKVFPSDGEDEAQTQFLPLFDGVSVTKRLYVLSVNHLSLLNEFMQNRPGRCHYHMRFAYAEPETVATYLRDQVPAITEAQIDEVVAFSRKYPLNFDHLRAIGFELRLGQQFADVIGDLNIKRIDLHDSSVDARITWEDGEPTVLTGAVDMFDHDSVQSIQDYRNDLVLRFRMRDTVSTAQGHHLRVGTFDLIDMRSDRRRDVEGDLPAVASVVLNRSRPPRVDF